MPPLAFRHGGTEHNPETDKESTVSGYSRGVVLVSTSVSQQK
jgi:hypothetical protein